jgi:hypothetical protein
MFLGAYVSLTAKHRRTMSAPPGLEGHNIRAVSPGGAPRRTSPRTWVTRSFRTPPDILAASRGRPVCRPRFHPGERWDVGRTETVQGADPATWMTPTRHGRPRRPDVDDADSRETSSGRGSGFTVSQPTGPQMRDLTTGGRIWVNATRTLTVRSPQVSPPAAVSGKTY